MAKSNMNGAINAYTEMFKSIMNWNSSEMDSRWHQHGTHKVLGNEDGHYIFNLSWALGDMGFHGWSSTPAKNENEIFQKVTIAYYYLLKTLAEAIGFEYPEEESVWKYDLQYIDTNDLLTFHKVFEERKKSKTPVGEDLTEKKEEQTKVELQKISDNELDSPSSRVWELRVYKDDKDEEKAENQEKE